MLRFEQICQNQEIAPVNNNGTEERGYSMGHLHQVRPFLLIVYRNVKTQRNLCDKSCNCLNKIRLRFYYAQFLFFFSMEKENLQFMRIFKNGSIHFHR